jgi:hypothetical protein
VVRRLSPNSHDQFRNARQAEKFAMQLAVSAEVPVVRALLMGLLQALQPEIDETHWSPGLAAARESIKLAEKERRERIVLGKLMAKKKLNATIQESNTDEPTGSGSRHPHITGQYSHSDEEEGTTNSSKDIDPDYDPGEDDGNDMDITEDYLQVEYMDFMDPTSNNYVEISRRLRRN